MKGPESLSLPAARECCHPGPVFSGPAADPGWRVCLSDHCCWTHPYLCVGRDFQKLPPSTCLLFLYFLDHFLSDTHSSFFSSQPQNVGSFGTRS